jgi:hypothetical protein
MQKPLPRIRGPYRLHPTHGASRVRDEARRQEATAQSRMCTLPLWAIARVAEALGVVALEGVARAALQAVAETRAASSEARARVEADAGAADPSND